jgi:hypothetical protein
MFINVGNDIGVGIVGIDFIIRIELVVEEFKITVDGMIAGQE